ncbi:YraN family protein [Burkholderia stabilis]|uniref:YraN family protein n=1 Tax=Burkholderia stabilis TaxID=95485 RepID=UPI000AE6B311|nr:YraN family protein [Burkholderia stabilis]HDR9495266.1 YraN family protein [Burkholderia stabilis]HDR9527170.1 YraN family protein [Burkholderia stabilis]HDR9533052.1 YraN family protein [Burkholderia stabilis]HDR9541954.1 YraN family protein [Burkholderia stabilis]HDR9549044.1 YraN family protein [Burkholderia stabilis]
MCHAAPARPDGGRGLPRAGDNFSGAARSKPVGAAFEQRARQFLERRGLVFVAANVTMRGGELDLVMHEPDGMLVFVEVRARRSARHGGAAASVGWRKRRRLVAAALQFWARHGAGAACRFDVVAFEAGRLVWLRDAFRTDDA